MTENDGNTPRAFECFRAHLIRVLTEKGWPEAAKDNSFRETLHILKWLGYPQPLTPGEMHLYGITEWIQAYERGDDLSV